MYRLTSWVYWQQAIPVYSTVHTNMLSILKIGHTGSTVHANMHCTLARTLSVQWVFSAITMDAIDSLIHWLSLWMLCWFPLPLKTSFQELPADMETQTFVNNTTSMTNMHCFHWQPIVSRLLKYNIITKLVQWNLVWPVRPTPHSPIHYAEVYNSKFEL